LCFATSGAYCRDHGGDRDHGVSRVVFCTSAQSNDADLGRLSFSPQLASAVLQQNARTAAAALLPPLTHLPPTMVIPGKKTVQAIVKGEKVGLVGEDREAPVLNGQEEEKAVVGNNVTGDE
jgi:hypothetical protein